jgi:hypothetical protein
MSRTSSSPRRPSASGPKLVQTKLVQTKPVQNKPVQRKHPQEEPVPPKPAPPSPRQRELTTKRRGELAELAFVLKAASLGFGVSRPFGDSERYDAILDARDLSPQRTRVERAPPPAVSRKKNASRNGQNAKKTPKKTPRRKQSLLPAPTPPDPSPPLWRVQVKCSTQIATGLYRVNTHRRANGRAVPYLPGEIHFFAVYIIPEDTWYILPLAATHGRTSLLFRRKRDRKPGRYDAYREAWHLLRPKR